MTETELEAALDALFERVDLAADEATDRREALIESALSELHAFSQFQEHPRVLYALAYAWYLHPQRRYSASIRQRVEELLLRATAADPTYFQPWLYLGHNRYDNGEYEQAVLFFERARALASEDYLGLKSEEMVLCCTIALYGLAAAVPAFARFVRSAEKHPMEDIWPRELAKLLEAKGTVLPAEEAVVFEGLCRRLDAAGAFTNWFHGFSAGVGPTPGRE
jgi:tetratricopeptide (TPR) repeat protein